MSNTHANFISVEVHRPYRQLFVDAASRLADVTVYTSNDLYKLALQLDSSVEYYLSSCSPPVWSPIKTSGVDITNVAIIDSGDSPFSAVSGTCVPINSTGNIDIYLADALSNANREIWFTLVSVLGGNTITVYPVGLDTIAGVGSFAFSSDYESLKLRSIDLGGGLGLWAIIG